MLRRLSVIGRENAVLRDLKNMPENLQSLYALLLTECQKGRTAQQFESLKKLFAWLAFSKRALNLGEAAALIKITVPDGSLDIEEEIIGKSAR